MPNGSPRGSTRRSIATASSTTAARRNSARRFATPCLAPGKRLRPRLGAAGGRGLRRRDRRRPARRLCGRDDPHLFAGARRPAGDGRRRPPPRPADLPQGVRRGDRRSWSATPCLARAFEVLAADVQPADRAARCCAVLGHAAGATALVGGQADDLAGGVTGDDLPSLESIHRRKTGALITASLELGGIVAGASPRATRRPRRVRPAPRPGVSNHRRPARRVRHSGRRRQAGRQRRRPRQSDLSATAGRRREPRPRRRNSSTQACEAVAMFGDAAEPLVGLANFVRDRNR